MDHTSSKQPARLEAQISKNAEINETNCKEKTFHEMKSTPEQMTAYIQALETGNKQLVIAVKRCLELLANVPPEVADKNK